MAANLLRLLLLIDLVLLAIGLTAPIVTLEKFIVIENTFSVYSGLIQLLVQGQFFLFVVVLAFSVILPIVKIAFLFRLTLVSPEQAHRSRRLLRLMHDYGRWSMLDVFIVALLVVAVKLGVFAQVEMRYGLYAFAAAVLLTMVLTERVVRATDRQLAARDAE